MLLLPFFSYSSLMITGLLVCSGFLVMANLKEFRSFLIAHSYLPTLLHSSVLPSHFFLSCDGGLLVFYHPPSKTLKIFATFDSLGFFRAYVDGFVHRIEPSHLMQSCGLFIYVCTPKWSKIQKVAILSHFDHVLFIISAVL